MNRETFCEALLGVMESKTHWAWPLFTSGQVALSRLHIHFEQEYEVYVRDFPVLVARAYVQCPVALVRRELAENIYEEETGGLVAGRPHPELFLEYPRGLGMDLERFSRIELLPAARVYRSVLDRTTTQCGWATAAAVATLFVEGTPYDRSVLDPNASPRPEPSLSEHPLVRHYGLPIEHLALTRAHRKVEGAHRESAWRCILDVVEDPDRMSVVEEMRHVLAAWSTYRDEIAVACGLSKPPKAE